MLSDLHEIRLYCDMEIVHQLGAQINSNTIFQQTEQNEFLLLFNIPWGHHKLIMDKCKNDQNKALFFVKKVIENNWSRAVLMNFLDTALYERDGVAITNFSSTLPEIESDLAQELTKDPYNFDFLTIRKGYDEKELKDAYSIIHLESFYRHGRRMELIIYYRFFG